MSRKLIRVAAGAILDGCGKVLLSQRSQHSHQGGLWEFPGGKLEPGETPAQALRRELQEELGIRPLRFRPLISLPHDYADLSVRLEVFLVERFSGEPQGLEGQPVRWVPVKRLRNYPMPEADGPIISALELPSEVMITGAWRDKREFVSRLASALERGIRLVQLRAPELEPSQLLSFAELALPLCRRAGARLQLNGDIELFDVALCDGIHLNRHRLMSLTAPVQLDGLLSASCHNLAELEQAQRVGCDYLLLSPVCRTGSHPGVSPLGWQEFASLAQECRVPVYALGGVGAGELSQAFANGAQGVAGISAYW